MHATPDIGPVKLVAELALTSVLFINATMIDRSVFAGESRRIPVRAWHRRDAIKLSLWQEPVI